mmetsp:Transcript_23949/g.32949  ORF Transcript_23949/g.32949 Transcript_23949/m.32949 type:complete len:85 (+) Transcript_23949:1544-1798(+)
MGVPTARSDFKAGNIMEKCKDGKNARKMNLNLFNILMRMITSRIYHSQMPRNEVVLKSQIEVNGLDCQFKSYKKKYLMIASNSR